MKCFACEEAIVIPNRFNRLNHDLYHWVCGSCYVKAYNVFNGKQAMNEVNGFPKSSSGWVKALDKVKEAIMPKIVSPNQFCMDCKLPAHHIQICPEGYLCKSCSAMRYFQ